MKVLVSRSRIKGRVKAPPSKSYTIRGLMCAALARGESRIINPLGSDDTEAALNVLQRIGVDVRQDDDVFVFEVAVRLPTNTRSSNPREIASCSVSARPSCR